MVEKLKEKLSILIENDFLHAKWLNTLSFLENCGAKKIAACQHPTLVKKEMLKHAAEEFRHAHHLKQQIKKVTKEELETYSLPFLLGGFATLHYLHALDSKTSSYLKSIPFENNRLKPLAYLLVTYAIEKRAEKIYPIYHEILKEKHSLVTVKAILLEEKEHLKEMEEGIEKEPFGWKHAEEVCKYEHFLYEKWIHALL